MRCGEEIWQTRSTWPMSMPSSSEAVATSTFSCPLRSRSSASSRTSFDRLPWCAATCSAPSFSRQVERHALGEAPRVHHDERRAVRLDQLDQALVDLLPDLARHHRFERRAGHLDGEIDSPLVAAVDDRASCARRRPAAPDEEPRHLLDRLLRRGEPDALQPPPADVVEPLEREREVRAAPRFEHGVDLVDDHDARGLQHLARALRGQQQVQRLRRRDEDVRRRAQHRRALALRRVAAAHRRGDAHRRAARSPRRGGGSRGAARRGSCGCRRTAPSAARRRSTRTSSGSSPRSRPSRSSSSIAVRNAASVLPEPVGAAISVFSPRRIACQPSSCASVGGSTPPSRLRRSGFPTSAGVRDGSRQATSSDDGSRRSMK